jgi:hypothetical protein
MCILTFRFLDMIQEDKELQNDEYKHFLSLICSLDWSQLELTSVMRSADKLSQDTSRGISVYRILAMGSVNTSHLQAPSSSQIIFPNDRLKVKINTLFSGEVQLLMQIYSVLEVKNNGFECMLCQTSREMCSINKLTITLYQFSDEN